MKYLVLLALVVIGAILLAIANGDYALTFVGGFLVGLGGSQIIIQALMDMP